MKAFDILPKLIERAKRSTSWLFVLNQALSRIVPFNRPHGFRIEQLGDGYIKTAASYKRVNRNHVRGIHACAIATVSEFSSGFLLLTNLDPRRFRLIMSRIEVDYLYQAKTGIISESYLASDRLEKEILAPLKDQEAVDVTMESRVSDILGNEIATARTTWQIKRWDRVRTKL